MHRKSVGFKTLTITCLALALISTISLNIIRTYSINNTRTNALDSSYNSNPSTLSDPSAIRLSITNGTNSCSNTQLTNAGDVCINTPTNDTKVAIGSHTLTIEVGDYVDTLKVTLGAYSNGNNNYLVNQSDSSLVIPPTNGSLTNPQSLTASDYNVGSWGYAIPGEFGFDPISQYTDTTTLEQAKFAKVPQGYLPDTILQIDDVNQPEYTKQLYYGIRLNNPANTQAGVYSQVITYTATATIPTPTLTRLLINDSAQQNQTSEFAIEGTNLDTVYDVWIDYNDNGIEDANEKATNVTTYPNTDKASTIISFTNPNPTSNTVSPGTYDVYAVGQGGTSKPLTNAFIVQEESTCRNGDPNSDCQVDIDDNMIPVVYNGVDENTHISREASRWRVVTASEINDSDGRWYDYGYKQWANAVTLRDDFEVGCYRIQGAGADPNNLMLSWESNPSSCSSSNLTPLEATKQIQEWLNTPGHYIGSSARLTEWTIPEHDILGYWVYIPRYAYEVQRPNAIDRVVTDEYPLPDNVYSPYPIDRNSHSIRNEFSIHFEKATDTKKTPAETCNTLNITNPNQMWANGTPTEEAGPDNTNILAKDYRTTCVNESGGTITRTYGSATGTTWATHPAFSWLDNDGNGEELNGLWVGKFETTGKVNAPTVKPNQHANINEYIGEFYTMARSIGVGTYDPANNGGNTITGITQNSHNLNKATSHMLKNSEWGAITYLASSKYGAGTNNVSINSADPYTSADADITRPSSSYGYGITGCGPNNINRSTSWYSSVTTSAGETVNLPALSSSHIEDPLACGDVDHSYIGDIGQLASTTNNVYGIYDMSGGTSEYVMGNLTSYDDQSKSYYLSYVRNPIKPPYVDLYKESLSFDSTSSDDTNPAWSYSTSAQYYNNDVCTWGTCGGHSLHETKRYQLVSDRYQSWGDDSSSFVYSNDRWFDRGGYAAFGSNAGLFGSDYSNGVSASGVGFRSVLLAVP